MYECGYLSGRITVARFNRRLHQFADWMTWISEMLGEVFTTGDVFIIDSPPLPVCRRARARRCRKKVRGRSSAGTAPPNGRSFWMALAPGLPTGWRARARSEAAGGVARPDARA